MLTEAETARFWAKVEKTDTCWVWTAATSHNYGRFMLRRLGRGYGVHRLSWELHFGPVPIGMLVCHHCNNPLCVRPDHLFLGAQRDNMLDMVTKGRRQWPKGIGGPSLPLPIRLWRKVTKTDVCWLWTGALDSKGYGIIGDGHGKVLRVHRASWGLHFGSIPAGFQVFQRCGQRSCVRPEHLGIGTAADTVRRMISNGHHGTRLHPERSARGESLPQSRLSDAAVRDIRGKHQEGKTIGVLSQLFGVSRMTVHRVLLRQSWKHVQ